MTDVSSNAPHKARNRNHLTPSQYIQRRNGVPLGEPGSLQNMLRRSLGAGSFTQFWQYWNPIWGYSLGRFVYAPLRRWMPTFLALILTFTISGAIHDLVATLLKGTLAFLFTPWFFLMSIVVIAEQALNIDYATRPFSTRVFINVFYISVSLGITVLAKQIIGI